MSLPNKNAHHTPHVLRAQSTARGTRNPAPTPRPASGTAPATRRVTLTRKSAHTPRPAPAYDAPCYVACLWPEYFQQVVAGTKRFEYRFREGDDPTLDKLRAALDADPTAPAPWLLIFESRTPRCLLTSVHAVRIQTHKGDRCYRLTLGTVTVLAGRWPRAWRPQGVRCVPWEVWVTRLPATLRASIRASQEGQHELQSVLHRPL